MRLLSAILLGYVAGTRSMLAPTAASWAATTGGLNVKRSPVSFLGEAAVPLALSTLATGELVADKLPIVPSRTKPAPFLWRVLTGAVAGAAVAAGNRDRLKCAAAGAAAATAGTLCGAVLRRRMAEKFGRDFPAALAEDALAMILLGLALQQMEPTVAAQAA
jgi:uncharacterized membrane protein